MKFFVFLISVVALATCVPVSQDDTVMKLVIGNFVNCMNSDLNMCLKEQALKATERLGTVRKLNIFEGVTIYNNGPKEARSLEPLSTEPEQRSRQINERLWESTTDLLQRSDLELSFNGSGDDEEESRSIDEEGRGKKKKQLKKKLKILIPLAILAKIKAVALVVLALLVIAASVFKLALLAKIAFIAKVIAIVKALIAKKHAQEEHTWVTAHEEHPHGGWESNGWSRSKNDGNSLAYSAYSR
ncbi:unnamed protein product [Parnassius mnemosyne]|uniref:Osiris 9 n=1 Tax=Parnassius mnemosyne TaxID=213953 RepID=A0AAV1LJS0_9NEOP